MARDFRILEVPLGERGGAWVPFGERGGTCDRGGWRAVACGRERSRLVWGDLGRPGPFRWRSDHWRGAKIRGENEQAKRPWGLPRAAWSDSRVLGRRLDGCWPASWEGDEPRRGLPRASWSDSRELGRRLGGVWPASDKGIGLPRGLPRASWSDSRELGRRLGGCWPTVCGFLGPPRPLLRGHAQVVLGAPLWCLVRSALSERGRWTRGRTWRSTQR